MQPLDPFSSTSSPPRFEAPVPTAGDNPAATYAGQIAESKRPRINETEIDLNSLYELLRTVENTGRVPLSGYQDMLQNIVGHLRDKLRESEHSKNSFQKLNKEDLGTPHPWWLVREFNGSIRFHEDLSYMTTQQLCRVVEQMPGLNLALLRHLLFAGKNTQTASNSDASRDMRLGQGGVMKLRLVRPLTTYDPPSEPGYLCMRTTKKHDEFDERVWQTEDLAFLPTELARAEKIFQKLREPGTNLRLVSQENYRRIHGSENGSADRSNRSKSNARVSDNVWLSEIGICDLAKFPTVVKQIQDPDTKDLPFLELFQIIENYTSSLYKAVGDKDLGLDDLKDKILKDVELHKQGLLVYLFNGVLASLQGIHKTGYGHGDVTLNNVILGQDFQIRATDFDSLKALEETPYTSIYNANYVPRELGVIRNVAGQDAYALGKVLFFLTPLINDQGDNQAEFLKSVEHLENVLENQEIAVTDCSPLATPEGYDEEGVKRLIQLIVLFAAVEQPEDEYYESTDLDVEACGVLCRKFKDLLMYYGLDSTVFTAETGTVEIPMVSRQETTHPAAQMGSVAAAPSTELPVIKLTNRNGLTGRIVDTPESRMGPVLPQIDWITKDIPGTEWQVIMSYEDSQKLEEYLDNAASPSRQDKSSDFEFTGILNFSLHSAQGKLQISNRDLRSVRLVAGAIYDRKTNIIKEEGTFQQVRTKSGGVKMVLREGRLEDDHGKYHSGSWIYNRKKDSIKLVKPSGWSRASAWLLSERRKARVGMPDLANLTVPAAGLAPAVFTEATARL